MRKIAVTAVFFCNNRGDNDAEVIRMDMMMGCTRIRVVRVMRKRRE